MDFTKQTSKQRVYTTNKEGYFTMTRGQFIKTK